MSDAYSMDPYSFGSMGTASDPYNYYADPGYSTNFAPTAYSPTGDAMVGQREAYAPVTSRSQVPGTSGSPAYTPSATPGGVSQGDGTGTPSTPSVPYDYGAIPGSLSGMLGLGGSNATSQGTNQNMMKLGQLGMKMMAPPPNPMAPGGGPQQQQQNPQAVQLQRALGVDYQTALALMQMMQRPQAGGGGGGYGAPQGGSYVPQMAYGGRPTGPTLVGERGPEMFVPDVPGSIVPLPQNRMAGSMQRNAAIHAALARHRPY